MNFCTFFIETFIAFVTLAIRWDRDTLSSSNLGRRHEQWISTITEILGHLVTVVSSTSGNGVMALFSKQLVKWLRIEDCVNASVEGSMSKSRLVIKAIAKTPQSSALFYCFTDLTFTIIWSDSSWSLVEIYFCTCGWMFPPYRLS